MSQPIDLYFWPTPNGWKISIALEEMALPYRTHLVNIGAGEQFDPDFLKIAPNNRMPAIIDPEGPEGSPVSILNPEPSCSIWRKRPENSAVRPNVRRSR